MKKKWFLKKDLFVGKGTENSPATNEIVEFVNSKNLQPGEFQILPEYTIIGENERFCEVLYFAEKK